MKLISYQPYLTVSLSSTIRWFFCTLHYESPWWVSMVEPIQNDNNTCLTQYLKHSIGLQHLCSTGLLKVGNSRILSSTAVVKAEWIVSLKNSNFLGL
jgi:hypothetical protein